MKTVNIHEAKTHLSRLIEQAMEGEDFIIAKAGKPMVRVSMISDAAPQRLGFLAGQAAVPDAFDRMAEEEIADLFEGQP
ncbi:MAG: type II toxin-antitoxin system prevent-host-death family antitoxin [Pseudomonadota bacterium]